MADQLWQMMAKAIQCSSMQCANDLNNVCPNWQMANNQAPQSSYFTAFHVQEKLIIWRWSVNIGDVDLAGAYMTRQITNNGSCEDITLTEHPGPVCVGWWVYSLHVLLCGACPVQSQFAIHALANGGPDTYNEHCKHLIIIKCANSSVLVLFL